MDEKTLGLAGAVAAAAILGQGARPAAKVAMKGVVAITEATAGAWDGLSQLYSEAQGEYRAEREARSVPATGAAVPPSPADPTQGVSG